MHKIDEMAARIAWLRKPPAERLGVAREVAETCLRHAGRQDLAAILLRETVPPARPGADAAVADVLRELRAVEDEVAALLKRIALARVAAELLGYAMRTAAGASDPSYAERRAAQLLHQGFTAGEVAAVTKLAVDEVEALSRR